MAAFGNFCLNLNYRYVPKSKKIKNKETFVTLIIKVDITMIPLFDTFIFSDFVLVGN